MLLDSLDREGRLGQRGGAVERELPRGISAHRGLARNLNKDDYYNMLLLSCSYYYSYSYYYFYYYYSHIIIIIIIMVIIVIIIFLLLLIIYFWLQPCARGNGGRAPATAAPNPSRF